MSEENVAVVRRLCPPNRELEVQQIAKHPDRVRDLYEPFIAEDFSVTFVGAGLTTTRHGAAAMSEGMREYMDAFLECCMVFDRFIDGGDVVVALGRQRGRTKTHGVEFDTETGVVFFFDPNGKLTRIEGYQRWSEALEAAGLSE